MGSKKVTLKSSDGQVFEVEEAVALESQIIKHTIEDCANGVIPIPNVTGNTLSNVIEYCKKHVEMQKPGEDNEVLDEDLNCWAANFVRGNELSTVYDLIMAANYLDIKSLQDLTCQVVADMIKGKTPAGWLFIEKVRRQFMVEARRLLMEKAGRQQRERLLRQLLELVRLRLRLLLQRLQPLLLQWFLMKEARKIAVQEMEESFLALEQARLMEEEEERRRLMEERRRLMEEKFNDLEQVFLEQERDLMFNALEQEDEEERRQRLLMEERFLALEQAMFLALEQFNEEEEDEGLSAIIYF